MMRDQTLTTNSALETIESIDQSLNALSADLLHNDRLAQLGTATAMIAHELRNLLTPIQALTELALLQPSNHELATKAINRSHTATKQASSIINTILELTHSSASTPTPLEVLELQPLVQRVIDLLPHTNANHHATTSHSIPPLVAFSSATCIEHILLNLTLNAHKHANSNNNTITITAEENATPCTPHHENARVGSTWNDGGVTKEWLAIHITDDGPGIPPDNIERLFQPFQQHQQPETWSEGHGLGLAISAKLADAVGGFLALSSLHGHSTRASLYLPNLID